MKILCLHTAQFPYGFGEQFLETEIKYLVEVFDRVVIIPGSLEGKRRPLPEGVEVLLPSYKEYSTLKGLLQVGRWVLVCLQDLRRSKIKSSIVSELLHIAYRSKFLHGFLIKNDLINDTLHYTYWFNEQSSVLAVLTSKGKIKGYISRAHRFDLYDEKHRDGFIPFRKLQLQNVTKLFLISQDGLAYMKNKYLKYQQKYELSYLGIENSRLVYSEKQQNNQFKVVSCSRVVDIKRLDIIARALSKIMDKSILWVHFGDGPLLASLKEMTDEILPTNIVVEFRGHVENNHIFDYYRENHIDCFINVSSSEGLPVTIMEAISFGIPVIATDVGGTPEITTAVTGLLLDVNCTSEDVSLAIEDVLCNKSRNKSFREGIYEFWRENFDAKKNYQEFSQRINEIDF